MCYILCTSSSVAYSCVGGGFAGGCRGGLGGEIPPWARGNTPQKKNCLDFHVTYLGGFSAHGFLPMVFYFRLRN
jgi:hypothetical protein